MEPVVEGKPREVRLVGGQQGRIVHFGDDGPHALDVMRLPPLDGVPSQLRLEQDAQVEELSDLGGIQRNDRIPAARMQNDHAFGFEPRKGFAERASTDTQKRRYFFLAQHLARHEEPIEDRATKLMVDLVGQWSDRRDEKFG